MKRLVVFGERQVSLEWKHASERMAASIVEQEEIRTREVSIAEVEPGVYSILLGSRSYEVRVAKGARKWIVQSRGSAWQAEVIDPRAASARRGGLGKEGRQVLAAPMPGKVVALAARAGASVAAGEELVTLE